MAKAKEEKKEEPKKEETKEKHSADEAGEAPKGGKNFEKPQFETVKSFDKAYGESGRKFIEITLKKVKGEDGTDFVSISKGYFGFNGKKIYRRSMGFPYTDELKKFVVDSVKDL